MYVMPSPMRIALILLIKWYHSILTHPDHKRSHMHIRDFCQNVTLQTHFGMKLLLTSLERSAKIEHFHGEFMHWYALTCIDTTTNLVELECIDTTWSNLHENLKIHGWPVSQDWPELPMTMLVSLWDIPLSTSTVHWESKTAPQPVNTPTV